MDSWNYNQKSMNQLSIFLKTVEELSDSKTDDNIWFKVFPVKNLKRKIEPNPLNNNEEDNLQNELIIKKKCQEEFSQLNQSTIFTEDEIPTEEEVENLLINPEDDQLNESYIKKLILAVQKYKFIDRINAEIFSKICDIFSKHSHVIQNNYVQIFCQCFLLPYLQAKIPTGYAKNSFIAVFSKHSFMIAKHVILPLMLQSSPTIFLTSILEALNPTEKNTILDLLVRYNDNTVNEWVLPVIIMLIKSISQKELNINSHFVKFLDNNAKNFRNNSIFGKLLYTCLQSLPKSLYDLDGTVKTLFLQLISEHTSPYRNACMKYLQKSHL